MPLGDTERIEVKTTPEHEANRRRPHQRKFRLDDKEAAIVDKWAEESGGLREAVLSAAKQKKKANP